VAVAWLLPQIDFASHIVNPDVHLHVRRKEAGLYEIA
jgi:hypothetical protein